jgi:hypothetical protein
VLCREKPTEEPSFTFHQHSAVLPRYPQHQSPCFLFLCGIFRSPRSISPLLLWPLVGPASSDKTKPTIEHWRARLPLSIFTLSTILTLANVLHNLALNALAPLPRPHILHSPLLCLLTGPAQPARVRNARNVNGLHFNGSMSRSSPKPCRYM